LSMSDLETAGVYRSLPAHGFIAFPCQSLAGEHGSQHDHRRMWIEETYGDLKDNGFDLERSALEHFLRLSRLTLAVALLYVWFLAFDTELVKHGLHTDVDRSNRGDLSLFRLAWDFLAAGA